MKERYKYFAILGILVVGLLLVFASGAKAAPTDQPFTSAGILSVTGSDFSIQGQAFVVNKDTVTKNLTGTVVLSSTLTSGMLVKVDGIIKADTKWYAKLIQVMPPDSVFAYTGTLKGFNATEWTLDTFKFQVGTSTLLPPFYAISDTVVSTYTVGAGGAFLSKEFKVLNSGVDTTYTYTGTLKTIDNDLWTVGDYTFLMTNVTLPPFFGINDTVKVTFKIVNGENVAIAVSVVETSVGAKTDTDRCENRLKDPPAVLRLATELKEDPAKIMGYFCLGFGVGEIRLAYKFAGNGFTPAMLLAMRANEMGWGEIKQLVANTPAVGTGTQGNPANNGKIKNPDPETSSSPSNTGGSNHGKGPDKDKSNHGKNK